MQWYWGCKGEERHRPAHDVFTRPLSRPARCLGTGAATTGAERTSALPGDTCAVLGYARRARALLGRGGPPVSGVMGALSGEERPSFWARLWNVRVGTAPPRNARTTWKCSGAKKNKSHRLPRSTVSRRSFGPYPELHEHHVSRSSENNPERYLRDLTPATCTGL